MDFTNQQQYARGDGPTQFAGILPSQPMFGNRAITTGAQGTIFQYDLVTVYGMGSSVANSDQTTRVMLGWDLSVLIGLLASTDMILRIFAVGGVTTTFVEVDTSPIAITGGAKWQYELVGPFAASHIRGTLQAASSNSTVEYHTRLVK